MNPLNTASLVAEYQRVRESLLATFPELAEDDETLADTIDGETGLLDAIADLIRYAREDEAVEEALDKIIAEMRERKARIGQRAVKRREGALALMQAAGIAKLERPDFTATVAAGRPKVVITDEAVLPQAMFRIKREPDKALIMASLKAGPVEGAALSNAEPVLTVRTR